MKPGLSERRAFLQTLLGLAGVVGPGLALAKKAEAAPRGGPTWVGGFGAGGAFRSAETGALPNPVGYATISWPRSQFSEALQTISDLGFKGVQFLGWVSREYAGPKIPAFRERLNNLKLKPVVLSCWNVELDPDRPQDESSAVSVHAAFFRDLGGLYLQVIDGGRPTKEYSPETIKALGDRMNALGKLAQDYGLELGYHPHFGSIGETRGGLARVLEATDPRYVKLIADVAHLALGGANPAEVIRTYHDRLILCHFKDVRKDVASLARQDRNLVRHKRYHFCEIGRGVVDFAAVVRAFRDVDFRGWVIVELDGNEPPPGGPAESARINLDAMKGLGFM